jgi:hypothetical protein
MKMKELISELEDISRFDRVFYVSAVTSYGLKELIEYLES